MILQGVGHPISCLGVCYANDPQKGGYTTPAPALDLTTSLRGDFVQCNIVMFTCKYRSLTQQGSWLRKKNPTSALAFFSGVPPEGGGGGTKKIARIFFPVAPSTQSPPNKCQKPGRNGQASSARCRCNSHTTGPLAQAAHVHPPSSCRAEAPHAQLMGNRRQLNVHWYPVSFYTQPCTWRDNVWDCTARRRYCRISTRTAAPHANPVAGQSCDIASGIPTGFSLFRCQVHDG